MGSNTVKDSDLTTTVTATTTAASMASFNLTAVLLSLGVPAGKPIINPWHGCSVSDCPASFGNAMCNEECSSAACLFDGGDCVTTTACSNSSFCSSVAGDDACHAACNSSACGWDGGDCLGNNNHNNTSNTTHVNPPLGPIDLFLYASQPFVLHAQDSIAFSLGLLFDGRVTVQSVVPYNPDGLRRSESLCIMQFVVNPFCGVICFGSAAQVVNFLNGLIALHQFEQIIGIVAAGAAVVASDPSGGGAGAGSASGGSALSIGIIVGAVAGVGFLIVGVLVGKKAWVASQGEEVRKRKANDADSDDIAASEQKKEPRHVKLSRVFPDDLLGESNVDRGPSEAWSEASSFREWMEGIGETRFDDAMLGDQLMLPRHSTLHVAAICEPFDVFDALLQHSVSNPNSAAEIPQCDMIAPLPPASSQQCLHVARAKDGLSPSHSLSPPLSSPQTYNPTSGPSGVSIPGSGPGSSPSAVPSSDSLSPGSQATSEAIVAGSPPQQEGLATNPVSPAALRFYIDELDADGNTPLMLACLAGRVDAVRALLDRRALLSVRNVEGLCAIHIACRLKHADCVDAILMANKHESQNTLVDGATPLHIASSVSAPDVVGVLLRWGAFVNAVDSFHTTPLVCAVRAHAVSCARLLLQASASTSMPDHQGWTALHWASSLGDRRLATLLVQYKCDIDVVNNKLCSPLMLAVREGNESVVLLLLERFAKRNLEDQLGRTALDYAREGGHFGVMQMLQDWTIGSRAKGVVQRPSLAPSRLHAGPTADIEINSVNLSPPSSASSRSSLSSLGSLLASFHSPGPAGPF